MNSDPTNPNDKRQERNRRPDEQPVQPVLPGLEKYVTTPDHEQAADQTELVEDSGRRRIKPPVQAKRTERAQRYKNEDDEDADDDDDSPKKSKRSKSSQGSPIGTSQPFTFSVDGVKTFLIQYWQSARSVCMAPVPFYEAMPRKGGYARPATFLAVGACGHAFIHFLWHPEILLFLGDVAFTMCLFLLLSGGIVALLKKFERQSDMEEVFRVLAYASPLLIPMGFQWLEIIGLIYMGVLWFLGLKTIYDQ